LSLQAFVLFVSLQKIYCMAVPVIMPRQGQSVESCIITEFFKSTGDTVQKGELLFSYETDKASFEEEAQESGTILTVFFEAGDEVPVLTNVLVIGEQGESFEEFTPGEVETTSSAAEETSKETASVEEDMATNTVQEITFTAGSVGQQFISPRARHLAEDKGIDIALIAGSGPGGRIIERDILQAVENGIKMTPLARKKAESESLVSKGEGSGLAGAVTAADLAAKTGADGGDYEITPLSNIRKIIASAMYQSLQNSAQLTHHLSADARRLLALRQRAKQKMSEGDPSNITINDFLCLAVIKALKNYRQVNAHFLGDSLKKFNSVHLGMAVDTERGLMVPAVRNADSLTIRELSAEIKTTADACRKGSVDPDILSPEAASFTVSNLGNYGVEMFTPIINLPQVAILGVNTIVPRPKDLGNGVYGFVPHIGLSLTYDHQAIDGGEATRFLKDIAIELENLEVEF
jgi:pyruvate dehydrogenase E2 component (dihydrolipoamide acetyltransferase)